MDVAVQQRSKQQILEIYDRNADMVYRLCYAYMKNAQDAEDLTQETFLRLMAKQPALENPRHEKAWLIVTASNLCKDVLKKWWPKNANLADYPELAQEDSRESREVLEAVLALSPEYKTAVYMYYYEGYSTAEIARYERCAESTVPSRLHRARKLLEVTLGGEKE